MYLAIKLTSLSDCPEAVKDQSAKLKAACDDDCVVYAPSQRE